MIRRMRAWCLEPVYLWDLEAAAIGFALSLCIVAALMVTA